MAQGTGSGIGRCLSRYSIVLDTRETDFMIRVGLA